MLTSYVNANYNGTVSQNWAQTTFTFSEGNSRKTANAGELWTTTNKFEFSNTVFMHTSGELIIENQHLCQPGWNEHIVITKNTGEPFSLSSLKFGWHGENASVTIKGYQKGNSSVRVQTVNNPSVNGTQVNLNWDGLLKVEIRGPQGNCIDDVLVKS